MNGPSDSLATRHPDFHIFAVAVVVVAQQGSCDPFSNTPALPAVHAGSETAVEQRARVVLIAVHYGPV